MTLVNWITLAVSALALVVAILSLVFSLRVQRRQIRAIDRDEAARSAADVTVRMERTGHRSYHIVVENRGPGTAFNLDVQFQPDAPVLENERASKFPHKELRHGEQIRILAAPSFGDPMTFAAKLRWTSEAGTVEEREMRVGL